MLIGLTGYKGSGKDTVADRLVAKHGFVKIAFADPIREMLRAGFALKDRHFNEDKETVIPWLGVSPRYLMQTLGTEWGRQQIRVDIWVRYMTQRLRYAREHELDVVISDVRFPNEEALVHAFDGIVIRIVRGEPEEDGHISELSTGGVIEDKLLFNLDTLERLYEEVDGLVGG